MKHLPAFKAALVAAGGIVAGRLLSQFSVVFLSAAIIFVMGTAAFVVTGRRGSPYILAGAAYLSLFFSFAFDMSLGLSRLGEVRPGDFRFFAGSVDETPRDASHPAILLKDCSGFDGGWRRIRGELVVSPPRLLPVNAGDRIFLSGKAGVVSDARNPGQFSLRSYYRLNGIAGRVFITGMGDVVVIHRDSAFNFAADVVNPVRRFIRDRIGEMLKGEEAGLAKAMVLGERTGITRETSENFSRSGTIHILAVSGLHVGFLTGILMTLASILRIPRRWRFFLIAPVLIFYAFVVGLSPSATRAVIMAVVVLFGFFLQRKSRVINSLGFAALFILVFSPSELFSPGFQLSFAAVLSIAFFYERMYGSIRRARPSLADKPFWNSLVSVSLLTIAATIGTVPLCAYYFDRISIAGVFANLIVVPLAGIFISLNFTFIFASLISSAVASLYAAAAQVVGFSILEINSVVGALKISSVRIGDSSLLFGALYLFWLTAVFLFGGNSAGKKLLFAALFGLDLILFYDLIGNRNEAKLFVLDVGQGDAIYVELPDGKNLLVDSGMRFGNYDVGARVVVPFLQRRGVKSLDYFVITHLHSDHIGGAVSVLRNVKVADFIYPEQISRSGTWNSTLAAARAAGARTRTATAGLILDSGPVQRIYVLHPNRKYVGVNGLSYRTGLNDGSIVLKICIGGESVLLAGDIERRAERDLVRVYGKFLSAGILKAGHHGSSTGSSPGFIGAVRPGYAVISVGAVNRFGHPSKSVIERLRNAGATVLRTDSAGAACFRIGLTSVETADWR